MQVASHPHLRGRVSSKRWDSQQAACVLARSAVACRRVVAKATKLSAKGATEDVEGLLNFESSPSNSILKIKRGLASGSRRLRTATPSKRASPAAVNLEDDEEEEEEEGQESNGWVHEGRSAAGEEDETEAAGFRAAALRDATATASTSGHAHLPSSSSGSRLTTAAAVASPRRVALNGFSLGSGALADPQEPHHYSLVRRSLSLEEDEGEAGPHQPHEQQASASAPDGIDAGGSATRLEQLPQQPKQQHPLPPGVTPERDKELHHELRDCEDWRDVLDVVTDEVDMLSLRTAVQALTRLNALSKGAGPAARKELTAAPEFERLLARLHAQVSAMNNVQLSNTLFALSKLDVPVPEETLLQYYSASTELAKEFYPRDIATLFNAASTMQPTPPQCLLDALGFRATGFLTAGTFDLRSLPMLLHSSAVMGYKNPILAQAAAQQLAVPDAMASLSPQGVANSLWALARMGTYHPPAVEAAMEAFAAAPLSYKPQECANLLWAMTAFRHHPGPGFALFAKSMLNRIDELRAADLATLLYSLGFFNVSPGPQVLGRIAARISTLMTAQDSAEAVSGPATTSTLAPTRGPRLTPKQKAAGRAVWVPGASSVNAVELCNMYWGLALLGEVQVPLFAQLEKRLAREWERMEGKLPDSLLRMIFQGFLASRLVESEASRPSELPPLVLDACKRVWTAGVTGPEALKRSRGVVEHVGRILDSLKVAHDKRRPTGDGLAMIDLAIKAGPEKYVALQVVSDVQHCANDSRQLLGTTIMQRQLLERNGWEVRYLSFIDLERLTPELQPMFVAELLRRLGIKAVTKARSATSKAQDGPAAAGPKPAVMSSAAAKEAEAAAKAADPASGRGGQASGRGGRKQAKR